MRPKPGDYFKRVWYGITIYGYAMTLDEIREQEQSLGADAEELDFTMKIMQRQYEQGFVHGQAWSVACPDGEYGLTPVRAAIAITKEEFENARAVHWED